MGLGGSSTSGTEGSSAGTEDGLTVVSALSWPGDRLGVGTKDGATLSNNDDGVEPVGVGAVGDVVVPLLVYTYSVGMMLATGRGTMKVIFVVAGEGKGVEGAADG